MGSPLGIVDVITESQYIFMELIYILEHAFHRNAVALSGKIHRVMQGFFFLIQVSYKTDNTFRLMIIDTLRLRFSSVFKMNGQFRIQISSLMKTAFYFLL